MLDFEDIVIVFVIVTAIVIAIGLGISGNNHVTDSRQKTTQLCILNHYTVKDCKELTR